MQETDSKCETWAQPGQTPVFVNKTIRTQPCSFMSSRATFVLENQSWVVGTDTGPQRLTLTGTSQKNVLDPWFRDLQS